MEPYEAVEMTGILIALAVISYLIAVDANKRGRSGVAWGLLTFFTCFISIPIYFLIISSNNNTEGK
jgi:hypothetical protein